jgi:hypothetical protein
MCNAALAVRDPAQLVLSAARLVTDERLLPASFWWSALLETVIWRVQDGLLPNRKWFSTQPACFRKPQPNPAYRRTERCSSLDATRRRRVGLLKMTAGSLEIRGYSRLKITLTVVSISTGWLSSL